MTFMVVLLVLIQFLAAVIMEDAVLMLVAS
jgi:hypothetical protein